MRIAVVDIGTNSTRLLIADVEDGQVKAELARDSTVTRLGAGVDTAGTLQPESIGRVEAVLERYAETIAEQGAKRSVAVLTSAVREAANGPQFAERIGRRFGLEPHVLPGEEEARLTFLGATSERDPSDTTPTLVIDIGGGSTELVIGHRGQVDFRVSTRAGVVRQSERHLHDDPPTGAQIAELERDVSATVLEAVPGHIRAGVRRAIAVAGTATALAAIDQGLDPFDPAQVHGYQISAERFEHLRTRIVGLPLQDREKLAGLQPGRAPTIVAGILILGVLLNLFDLGSVEVSEHDILRGAALGL